MQGSGSFLPVQAMIGSLILFGAYAASVASHTPVALHMETIARKAAQAAPYFTSASADLATLIDPPPLAAPRVVVVPELPLLEENHRLVRATVQAGERTGVEPAFLLAVANLESGMDVNARPKQGGFSARGLFQFIDTTWMRMVKEHGAQHGLEHLAGAIKVDQRRAAVVVPNRQLRKDVLALRKDVEVSTLLTAATFASYKDKIRAALGREAKKTEIYMLHFLGEVAGLAFVKAASETPGAIPGSRFSAAVRANQRIFMDQGRRLSYGQVMKKLKGKLDDDYRLYAAWMKGYYPKDGAHLTADAS